MNTKLSIIASSTLMLAVSGACFSTTKLEEVYVTAELFDKTLLNNASSVMVIDERMLKERGANQLEDVINMIPNVNFASGASRGKYFQIRGIGERSEFIEPINPSVGILIDGIDFTSVGGVVPMLDVEQLEVLRGPQGTLNGANALAGLMNLSSVAPEKNFGETNMRFGNYGQKEFSQSVSGQVTDSLGLRVSAGSVKSDGFIKNTYLNRDDNNNIDESTFKTHMRWQAADSTKVNFTGIVFDADNGYDAFTLDNSRNTLSDEPGEDSNNVRAASVNIDHAFDEYVWKTLVSRLDSDATYSYDVDWTYRTICAIDDPCAFWQYSQFDSYQREKNNYVVDSRLIRNQEDQISYVVGVYYRDAEATLNRLYIDNDPNFSTFYGPITEQTTSRYSSEFETTNLALYSQIDIPLATDTWVLSAGLRYESGDFDFDNSEGEQRSDKEAFWGGKLALEYRPQENQFAYALVSRGYKSGGANVPSASAGPAVDQIPQFYDPEYLWNFELGHKATWMDGRMSSSVVLFYQARDDIQVKQSLVTSQSDGSQDGPCPCDFTDFTDNVDSAVNYGLELELRAALNDSISAWLFASGLSTEYKNFRSYSHYWADPGAGEPYDLSGRDQAHAPNYQMSLGLDTEFFEHWHWQISTEAKSNFYLSTRHNVTTESYVLLNSQIAYRLDNLELAIWGKNLSDEDVIVRGFGSFGNDPRACDSSLTNGGPSCYAADQYFQYGNPRQFGVSARLEFN